MGVAMKKILFLALCFTFVAVQAHAQMRFGLGLSVGGTGFTQDVFDENIDEDIGIIGSGKLLLQITDWFLVGLDAEGGVHNGFEVQKTDLGSNSTISLIPFVEFRGPANAYLFMGVGYNLNSFSMAKPIDLLGLGVVKDLEMDDTVAFKFGAGWDIFATDHLALNVELGWKYNGGDAYFKVVDGDKTKKVKLQDGFDASEVIGQLGVRYYFDL